VKVRSLVRSARHSRVKKWRLLPKPCLVTSSGFFSCRHLCKAGAKAKGQRTTFPAHWPAGVRQCMCYPSFSVRSSLDKKALPIYPATLQQWVHMEPCCNVCAYSLNVSHLVRHTSLTTRCKIPGAPIYGGLVTACSPPPHVVTCGKSQSNSRFFCRLIPLYHDPNDHMFLFSLACSFCTLPLLSFSGVTVPLPATGVPVTSCATGS
jgi:hypothetical protein